MAAIADGWGRIVAEVDGGRLRGPIPGAAAYLAELRRGFDPAKAARKPYAPPAWARAALADGGADAMGPLLRRVDLLRGVWRSLEVEAERIRFALNYVEALVERAGKNREPEFEFLEEITYAPNDSVKFAAIEAFGRVAPLARIGFLAEREKRKAEGCRNPNVVLCRCLQALAEVAKRATPKDREAVAAATALPRRVLDEEARNNGACRLARDALAAMAEQTGAPEALEAYIHALGGPEPRSDFVRKMADRFTAEALEWLRARTGQRFGADEAEWRRWYEANAARLRWDPSSGRFSVR